MFRNTGFIVVSLLIVAAPVSVQEVSAQDCDPATGGITNATVLSAANNICCRKSKAAAQRSCIRGAILKLNKATTVFGEAFVTAAVADLNSLLNPLCGTVVSDGAQCITTDSATTNATNVCCAFDSKGRRNACLNKNRRDAFKTKQTTSKTFVAQIKKGINAVKKSSCGVVGDDDDDDDTSSLKCNVEQKVHDGPLNGFLHKPSGDFTSEIVVLIPDNLPTASACAYHRKDTGKKIRSFFYTGRANGNRQHWRPSGNGSCNALNSASKKKGLVFRCKIRGKFHCWGNKPGDGFKNACDRAD